MELDVRTKNLIAVGAAVAANCLPCLEFTTNRAIEDGLAPWEIAAAAEVARKVRAGAASRLDALAETLARDFAAMADGSPVLAKRPPSGCGCSA